VHTDKAAATAKAKAMISGGVERVRHHVPLEPMTVPINPATLIVAEGLRAFKARWRSQTPASMYIWWNASRPSAAHGSI